MCFDAAGYSSPQEGQQLGGRYAILYKLKNRNGLDAIQPLNRIEPCPQEGKTCSDLGQWNFRIYGRQACSIREPRPQISGLSEGLGARTS